jgi:hypothetical protein
LKIELRKVCETEVCFWWRGGQCESRGMLGSSPNMTVLAGEVDMDLRRYNSEHLTSQANLPGSMLAHVEKYENGACIGQC